MFLGPAGPKNKVGAWARDPPLDPPMADAVSSFCILYKSTMFCCFTFTARNKISVTLLKVSFQLNNERKNAKTKCIFRDQNLRA